MYPGYEFTSWIEVDVNGEFVSELSTQPSYLLNVSKSMYVRATWARKEYNVTFNNLSDFECNVTNEVQEFGANYYNEQLTIEVAVNSNIQDLYVVELFSNNISINNQNIVDIITGENLMRVDCEIDNERKMGDKKTGFNSLVITLNICEDVDISLDYKYLYKLEIKSGNHVNIDNLKSIETVEEGGSVETHFTQVLNNKDAGNSSIYYEQIDKYIYLVEENQNITIIQSAGNNIYKFAGAKFNDNEIENDPSNKNNTYNQEITSHTIFWIYYEEVEYTISFSSYIKNLSNDYYDGLGQSVYNIPDII
jgi:hypothetical protein